MPKITWLGDEPCLWNEVTFPAGVPVETDDPYMIGKARHNPFFRLEDAAPTLMPETWTNTSEDDVTDRHPIKRKRGRPPKVKTDAI